MASCWVDTNQPSQSYRTLAPRHSWHVTNFSQLFDLACPGILITTSNQRCSTALPTPPCSQYSPLLLPFHVMHLLFIYTHKPYTTSTDTMVCFPCRRQFVCDIYAITHQLNTCGIQIYKEFSRFYARCQMQFIKMTKSERKSSTPLSSTLTKMLIKECVFLFRETVQLLQELQCVAVVSCYEKNCLHRGNKYLNGLIMFRQHQHNLI